MYDIIGDIHGHKETLEALLAKLGYEKQDNSYEHPERKIIFVGDYIDRGPDNPGVVNLVRNMVGQGNAIAIMGNHEYNAILYNLLDGEDYLRPHIPKNIKQHAETVKQYEGKQNEYDEMISWFKTLPLYYEDDNIRVMHACWHYSSMELLKQRTANGVLNDRQYRESADKSTALYKAVDITCKGLEEELPDGITFTDKDGTVRSEIRLKWWENPTGKTVKEMSVIDIEMEDEDFTMDIEHYAPDDKPVYFGHYWLQGTPAKQKDNVCCLDYSVAKDGKLCAYRWDGESKIDNQNIIWV